jgi:formylglycine-generating enzyme required for sulfatase activity
MNDKDYISNENGTADPISPIDFTPNSDKSKAFSYQFKWFHAFVSLFLLGSVTAAWFVLTAKSVFIEVEPIVADINIDGGASLKLGQRYLMRRGSYQLTLQSAGYHDTVTRLLVSEEQSQTHPFTMRKLPGIISFASGRLSGARVRIDGVDIGETPLIDVAVEPGEHQLSVSKERYLDYGETITVQGKSVEQGYEVTLEPAWAIVSLNTTPAGADVLVDGETIGSTPISAEILQGQRDFVLKLAGYKAWQEELDILAGESFSVPLIELEPADGLLFIQSNPSAASVTIGGEFRGLTPLEVALPPDQNHELIFFKNGYKSNTVSIRTQANEERDFNIKLDPILATVSIKAEPVDAELYVDGEYKGLANQTIELMAANQQIEIRKTGYIPYSTEFTSRPGLEQLINVSLKSLEQARLEQIKPVITSAAGQVLKLFYPGTFTMGASRREAGRRPNESLRDIKLERPFYLGLKEITNAEFRLFDESHSSGTLQGLTLDNMAQPVVHVSWAQAALYCNWLSDQESLPHFYEVDGEDVIGFNPQSTGYRLPSEAEWAWAARTDGSGNQLKYSWGSTLPPTENSGNFADISSQSYLGQILFNYNDGYLATAAVASFNPNQYGLYDMAGNVAEWVHDFYGAAGAGGNVEIDPLGPATGQFHTIRGSSWAHGSVTELRLSFRDFGEEARDDVGFRVARYLEK